MKGLNQKARKKGLDRYLYIIFTFLILPNSAHADKDRAPVTLTALAESRTRQIGAFGLGITEEYWLLGITLRNDWYQDFPVDAGKFKLLGSDGYAVTFTSIPEIPIRNLFPSITVRPNETVRGYLGFKLKSKPAYPLAIIYETTFLVATGQVYLSREPLLTQSQPVPPVQKSIIEESPYSSSSRQPVIVRTPSPEEKEIQRIRAKATQLATLAKDSVTGILEAEIVMRYIKLQDQNKSDYEKKKIGFNEMMDTKDRLEREKKRELMEMDKKAQDIYQDTFTRYTTDYYRKKTD